VVRGRSWLRSAAIASALGTPILGNMVMTHGSEATRLRVHLRQRRRRHWRPCLTCRLLRVTNPRASRLPNGRKGQHDSG
jgi:hypothetical protein